MPLPAAPPEPFVPFARWWRIVAALALLWLALLGFYTRGNGFPYYYHNDEPSKIAQVLGGKRNFYHPQLLLVTAEAILRAEGGTGAQACAVAGRTASAGFAAGAVCLLALLAYRLRGLAAAVAAAALAGTHPLLYELAHYMKEDCAWLCGLAAFFLAAWNLEVRPTAARAALLGAAAGLAVSGKYLGIICLPAGALFVWRLNRQTGAARGRWLGWLAGGCLLVFCAVNWQALAHPFQALAGVRQETVKLETFASGQAGLLNWKAGGKYLKHAWPAEAPLAAAFAGWFFFAPRRRRETLPAAAGRSGAEWLLLLLPTLLLLLLFFAPRVYDRYLLPVVIAHALLAALGAAAIGSALARLTGWTPARSLATVALGLLAAAAQWSALAQCQREFQSDPRAELCAFLRANVPPDAPVAHDSRALLTWGRQAALSPAYAFPQPTIQGGPTLADLGPLEFFRPWGVRWFVVTEEDSDSLLHPPYHRRTAAQAQASYDAFYVPLFAQGRMVWECSRGRLSYQHPALRVYRLPDLPTMPADLTRKPASTP